MVLLFFVSGVVAHKSIVTWRWSRAASAAGSMPYQIGLTNVVMVKCVVSCNGGCCVGGALCSTKDSATCTNYFDVSGSMAGGMGTMALFSIPAITQAGLTAGGQLIAGGMSMNFMDQGVLASTGGCSGCSAKGGTGDKIYAWLEKLDKYIIAGFKSN